MPPYNILELANLAFIQRDVEKSRKESYVSHSQIPPEVEHYCFKLQEPNMWTNQRL